MAGPRLTQAQLKELRDTFSLFDKNHDGVITFDELEGVVDSLRLQLTKEEVETMMTDADRNGDGCIEFSEFVLLMAPTLETSDASLELREAFDVFDKDGSGKITARELKQAMRIMGDPVTDEEAIDLIKEADWDGDGMISYEEFVGMMANGKNPDQQPSTQENGRQSETRTHFWGRKENEGGEQKGHRTFWRQKEHADGERRHFWGHSDGEHKEHKEQGSLWRW